jgi:hypothetical protein
MDACVEADRALPDAVADFLDPASSRACLLLVHADVRVIEVAAEGFVVSFGCERLAVGRELSAALLAESSRRRPSRVQPWLTARLGAMGPGPVVCTGIDVLFEPGLQLDPLGLLLRASRQVRLVVGWPGGYADDVLSYAVPAHAHHRAWRRPDVAVHVLGAR